MIASLSVRTTGVGAGAAAWEIRTGATPGRWKLIELHILLGAATASSFALGRPAAIGVTPTSPVDFDPEDPNDVIATGVLQSALAWATGPTAPAKFIRRLPVAATLGNGSVFTFPEGIAVPVSSSLVIWNITANPVADMTAVFKL